MPPPSTAKKKSLDELQEHQDEIATELPSIIVITAPPGAGKTSLAATAFHKDVAARLNMTAKELKDQPVIELPVVWFGADHQSTLALKAKRIKPAVLLDLGVLIKLAGGSIQQAHRNAHEYIEAAVAEKGVTGIVIDSATAWGIQWMEKALVDGSENKLGGWQVIQNEYANMAALGKELGLRQIWLCHPQENRAEEVAQSKKGTELDSAKALAASMAGGTNYLISALSGKKFLKSLNSMCSISGWLRAKEVNGKVIRDWMPAGGDGFKGKHRYHGILDAKEPADLYAMDQKILAAIGE